MASRDCSHSFKNFTAKKEDDDEDEEEEEEKLQNIQTTVGGRTYLNYFDFGDMDSSLAYIEILDYWYWKVVDYRIQVTFGKIKKLFILLNNTCPI